MSIASVTTASAPIIPTQSTQVIYPPIDAFGSSVADPTGTIVSVSRYRAGAVPITALRVPPCIRERPPARCGSSGLGASPLAWGLVDKRCQPIGPCRLRKNFTCSRA
jgi:hypothetical protein